MSMDDAIYEVFAPLSQGAPGNDAETLRALDAVPGRDSVRQVLDLGVGRGRTTFALVRALRAAHVTAVEIHSPFVEQMITRSFEAGVSNRVRFLCGDMEALDIADGSMDLVWAEGSIYLVGIERALAMWRPWLRTGGCIAFSDFVWWTDEPSREVAEFWASEYPGMATEAAIRSTAEAVGYRVISTFRMSKEAHDAYYVPLEERVTELAESIDADVLAVLEILRKEIDVARRFAAEAGYTFFIIQRTDQGLVTGT